MSDRRWCIWIDLEGFRVRYGEEGRALKALRRLVVGVYRIGKHAYPEHGERLFAHQFGDGVAILSDCREESLDRCASIAVALMRDVSEEGFFARAGIAEGDFVDVGLPAEIREAEHQSGDDRTFMGHGLLTTTQVMGTALISAVKMQEARVKGPLLLCARDISDRISEAFPRCAMSTHSSVVALDWVRASSPLIAWIQKKSGLVEPGSETMCTRLREYCARSPGLPRRWQRSAAQLAEGETGA